MHVCEVWKGGCVHKIDFFALSHCRQLENVNGTVYLPVLYINQVLKLKPSIS